MAIGRASALCLLALLACAAGAQAARPLDANAVEVEGVPRRLAQTQATVVNLTPAQTLAVLKQIGALFQQIGVLNANGLLDKVDPSVYRDYLKAVLAGAGVNTNTLNAIVTAPNNAAALSAFIQGQNQYTTNLLRSVAQTLGSLGPGGSLRGAIAPILATLQQGLQQNSFRSIGQALGFNGILAGFGLPFNGAVLDNATNAQVAGQFLNAIVANYVGTAAAIGQANAANSASNLQALSIFG